jgi:hypothetical protein
MMNWKSEEAGRLSGEISSLQASFPDLGTSLKDPKLKIMFVGVGRQQEQREPDYVGKSGHLRPRIAR